MASVGRLTTIRFLVIVDSFGPRTTDGVAAWDTFMTLVSTAKKLGVSFYAYVLDRVTEVHALPSLAKIIRQCTPVLYPTGTAGAFS